LRTPAERAIRNNAPFEAATGGTFRMSRFPPPNAAANTQEGATRGANFTNEANGNEVAVFT
jgi:hypothetical protein